MGDKQNMVTCAITGKEFETLRGFLNHLRTLKMSSREYYDMYVKKEGEDVCSCGNKRKYYKFSYSKYCGSSCPELRKHLTDRVSEKFKGSDREEKLKAFKEKRVGFDPNIQKRVETLKKKAEALGISLDEYYSRHGKNAQSNVSRETRMLATEKAMITKGSGFRNSYKKYELFGEQINVQGYEPVVLDYLQLVVSESDLVVSNSYKQLSFIKYNSKSCESKRMYYPDAMVKGIILEVKSEYTLNKNRENLFEKIGGVFDCDKSIIVVVPSGREARKRKLEGSKKLLDWAISSQASNHRQPFVAMYDEGSTTILLGVESSDSKCRGSSRILEERDIVWSSVKAEVV